MTRNEFGAFFRPVRRRKNPALTCAEASGVRWVKAIKFIEEKRKKIARSRRPARPNETPE